MSPFIEGSDCPDFIRDQIGGKLNDEFYRYSQVIINPSNDLAGLKVITNNEKAANFW